MADTHFDAAHYDRESVWEGHRDDAVEQERARATADLLGRDIGTVLDVGAGAGVVTDELRRRGLWVVAVDLATVALKQAGHPCCIADASRLPVGTASVDAVVTTEVLEHLTAEVFDRVASEIARVARRSLIVSVPNREILDAMSARCADCGTSFHPWRHTRSFDRRVVAALFADHGFVLDRLTEFGPTTSYPPARLARAAQAFGGWLQPTNGSTVCPACGNGDRFVRRNNLATLLLRSGPRVLSRRRPYWILASYVRV